MSRTSALIRGLGVVAVLLTAAGLFSKCLDCGSATELGLVVLCTAVLAALLALIFYYVTRRLYPRLVRDDNSVSNAHDPEHTSHRENARRLIVSNSAINASILVLGGMWVVAALTSIYPSRIPLVLFIAGVSSVVAFEAAAPLVSSLRRALQHGDNTAERWRWIGFAVLTGVLLVIAITVVAFPDWRLSPAASFVCGIPGAVLISAGLYRAGLLK
jgi:predicted metal-binding membrane protein